MIVIALGANLDSQAGAPRDTLFAALRALEEENVHVLALSPFYRTRAWPDPNDPDYINAAAIVASTCLPRELMTLLEQTETRFGRKRSVKNSPRTLDLDIVDYDGRVAEGPPVLPHPRLRDRAFVLVPLADIAPGWRHPATGETVEALIAALPGGIDDIARL